MTKRDARPDVETLRQFGRRIPARDEVADLEERMLQAIEHLYQQQGLSFDPER